MANETKPATAVTDPNTVPETYVERVMVHRAADNIVLTFMVDRPFPGEAPKPRVVVTARLVMHYSAANELLAQLERLRDGIALHETPLGSAH